MSATKSGCGSCLCVCIVLIRSCPRAWNGSNRQPPAEAPRCRPTVGARACAGCVPATPGCPGQNSAAASRPASGARPGARRRGRRRRCRPRRTREAAEPAAIAVIVDASLVIDAVADSGPRGAAARQQLAAHPATEPLIAPGHFAFEVMSGLRAAAGRPDHPLQDTEIADALAERGLPRDRDRRNPLGRRGSCLGARPGIAALCGRALRGRRRATPDGPALRRRPHRAVRRTLHLRDHHRRPTQVAPGAKPPRGRRADRSPKTRYFRRLRATTTRWIWLVPS